eukprot:tig00021108_g18315.t1
MGASESAPVVQTAQTRPAAPPGAHSRGLDQTIYGANPPDAAEELREIRQSLARLEREVANVNGAIVSLTATVNAKLGTQLPAYQPPVRQPSGVMGHAVLAQSGQRSADSIPRLPLGDGRPKEVFISYASKDKDAVHPLVDKLAQGPLAGKIWIDVKEIHAGSAGWRAQIAHAASESRVAVCILSPNYFASVPCSIELDIFAEKREKKQSFAIIPVMLSGDIPQEFKFHLSGLQYIAWAARDSLEAAVLSELRAAAAPAPPNLGAGRPGAYAYADLEEDELPAPVMVGGGRPPKPITAAPAFAAAPGSAGGGLFGTGLGARKEEESKFKQDLEEEEEGDEDGYSFGFGDFGSSSSFGPDKKARPSSGLQQSGAGGAPPKSGLWHGTLPIDGRPQDVTLELFFHFGRVRGEGFLGARGGTARGYTASGTFTPRGDVEVLLSLEGDGGQLELKGRHRGAVVSGTCRALPSGALLRLLSSPSPQSFSLSLVS